MSDFVISGGWKDLKGNSHKLEDINVDHSGEIIEWPLSNFPGVAQELEEIKFRVNWKGDDYKTITTGPVKVDNQKFAFRLTLTLKDSVSTTQSDNIDVGVTGKDKGWVVYGTVTIGKGELNPLQ